MGKSIFAPILMILFFYGCAGVTVLHRERDAHLYRQVFLQRMNPYFELMKVDIIGQKSASSALSQLLKMKTGDLLDEEKALLDYHIGKFEHVLGHKGRAKIYYDRALPHSMKDMYLENKIRVDLVDLDDFADISKSINDFLKINSEYLPLKYQRKFHSLGYKIFKVGANPEKAIFHLLSEMELEEEARGLHEKNEAKRNFLIEELEKIPFFERDDFLVRLNKKPSIVFGILSLDVAEKFFSSGHREKSIKLMEWIKKFFIEFPDITKESEKFLARIESFSEMNRQAIGILLPLGSTQDGFVRKALNGIFFGQKTLNSAISMNLHIRDTSRNASAAKVAIQDLLEGHAVSVIIGGLFPHLAIAEYLEAKKYGVLYISLSPIYLPREQKNSLLIEIPGSVESLVENLFSTVLARDLGGKVAMLYPADQRGKSYAREFLSQGAAKGFNIKQIQSFDTEENDPRVAVAKLLGASPELNPQGGLDFLGRSYELDKNNSVRKNQSVLAEVGFEWVFMPTLADEALKLIPTFKYYDVNEMKFVGGSAWRSQSLISGLSSTPLIYLGESYGDEVNKTFFSIYGNFPGALELRAYDAYQIAVSFLSSLGDGDTSDRKFLAAKITSTKEILGVTGRWNLHSGLWLKAMKPMRIYRGKITSYALD